MPPAIPFPPAAAAPAGRVAYDLPYIEVQPIVVVRCRCSRPEPVLPIRNLFQQTKCPACQSVYRIARIEFDVVGYERSQMDAGVPDDQINPAMAPCRVEIQRSEPLLITPPTSN